MIVVAIIGILAAVATGKFSNLVTKSKEAKIKSSLAALRSGLSIYYSDNQAYPSDLTVGLATNGKYLASIPLAEVPSVEDQGNPGHGSGNAVAALVDDSATGQWAYLFTANGECPVYVNCTHHDTRGEIWTTH